MKILMLGDLSYDYDYVADDIKDIGEFAGKCDASVILNLEGGISDGNRTQIKKRGKHLRQKGKCIEAMRALNTIGVTLANNHIMDYGKKGLSDTLIALEDAGIKYCGAGMKFSDAIKPMLIDDGDKKIAVFNFGWDVEETVYAGKNSAGCAPRKNDLILKTIVEYNHNNPLQPIIVTMHWGFEYNLYPQPFDIDLAHKLCNIKNVKAVIGHHPHCPQPMEYHNGKPIYYSLGNFYFASRRFKYDKRKFNFEPSDMSNYGLGVMMDTVSWEFEPVVMHYDLESDRTLLIDTDILPVKMPDMDINSSEYRKLAEKHAMKGNPILGTNENENIKIIFKYNSARNLMRYTGGAVELMHKSAVGRAAVRLGRKLAGLPTD